MAKVAKGRTGGHARGDRMQADMDAEQAEASSRESSYHKNQPQCPVMGAEVAANVQEQKREPERKRRGKYMDSSGSPPQINKGKPSKA